MAISLFWAYFVSHFVAIATVKFKYMSKFYTSVIILLINQSKVWGSWGGQNSPLMHIPLWTANEADKRLVLHGEPGVFQGWGSYIVTTGQCTVTSKILNSNCPNKKACTNSADPDLRSSLIRVSPVCYSDKHFVSSSFDNQKCLKF